MKELYLRPVMDLVLEDCRDIVTASYNGGGSFEDFEEGDLD